MKEPYRPIEARDPGKALSTRSRQRTTVFGLSEDRASHKWRRWTGRGRFDIAVWCNSPRGWTVTGLFLRLLLAITLKTATSCGRGNRAAWGIVPDLISLPSLRSSHNIHKNVGISFLRGNVNYYWRNNSSSLTLNCDILSNLTRNILFPFHKIENESVYRWNICIALSRYFKQEEFVFEAR